MKDEQILKKVIDKAEKNGFEMLKHKHFCEIGTCEITGSITSLGAYESIIFDHNFAKAFWGEKNVGCGHSGCGGGGTKCCGKLSSQTREQLSWQYHLQQMVLEENPIKYLERFIK